MGIKMYKIKEITVRVERIIAMIPSTVKAVL